MDFTESNRLYELAAEDPALDAELKALYSRYTEKMHEYLTALARRYGIELEPDVFLKSADPAVSERRTQRLKTVGLILRKKPEEHRAFLEFSRALDAEYAEEKVRLAGRYGVRLGLEEAKELSMWTGVI